MPCFKAKGLEIKGYILDEDNKNVTYYIPSSVVSIGFDYDDGTLETFYGLYAAIENLHYKTTMSYSTCEKLLINNCDEILEIEI